MKTLIVTLLAFGSIIPNSMAQSFTGSFDLIASQQSKSGNSRSDTVSYFFGDEKTAMLIHGKRNEPDMRMIFNPMDTAITALFEMNGRKGGYILPMDEEHWPGLPQSTSDYVSAQQAKMNYTGEEKMIEGHLCREVKAENEDYYATLWIAEDIPLSMTRVLSYQSVGKGKSKKEIELFDQLGVEGMPLEMFLKHKGENADVTIQIVNLSDQLDKSIFSTEGHQLGELER